MPSLGTLFSRRLKAAHRRGRELLMIAKGVVSTGHPVLAHVVPIRRCNLACAYCNEYDHVSPPVPLGLMLRRIDALARLGTTIVTVSGGEPLLHPELDEIVGRVRQQGMLAGLITNGYLLTAPRIQRLNRAGLDHLQISIDNVVPDEISKKSLKVLDRKLQLLAAYADFHVNINSVLGAGLAHPQDALTIAHRAVQLGLTSTVGIIHDGEGQMRPLEAAERAVFDQVRALGKSSYARFHSFQENLAAGQPNTWRCRAGARYLYICEDGLVHYCSQQRGYPAKPLEHYSREDIRREFRAEKPCAPHCTLACAHQVSCLDNWRAPQSDRPAGLRPQTSPGLVQIEGD